MKRKTYKTKRLVLRPLAFRDFQRWWNSQELSKPKLDKFDKAPFPRAKRTRAIFNQAVKRHLKLANTDETYVWNIFLRNTGEMIGHIDISTISRDPYQMANLGYFLINTYRGKGFGKEALQAIIPAGFRDLKYHRLEAATDLDNRASIRLAKSCGLVREGVKKHYWFQNGRWEDQLIFVATPELWRRR